MLNEIDTNEKWYEGEASQKWDTLYIEAANDSQLSLNHMLALCNSLKRRIVVYVS